MRVLRAAMLATLTGLGGGASADTLYGITGYVVGANEWNAALVEIDLDTRASRVVGDLYEGPADSRSALGIAARRGALIGLVSDLNGVASLVDIDRTTGRATHRREVRTDIWGEELKDLAYHHGSDRFWTLHGNELVRINPRNGRARAVSTIDGAEIHSIAFLGNRLFGTNGGSVFQISRKTGRLTHYTAADYWSFGSIGGVRGQLYASSAGALISMIDGFAEGVAPTYWLGSMTGMRDQPSAALMAERRAPAPVPIPAAGAMLVAATGSLAALGAWKRRRRTPSRS